MIVIDANVAVKWYLPEKEREDAIALLSGTEILIAPEIIRIEVLAAITRTIRERGATIEEAELRCRKWLRHLDERVVTLRSEDDLLDRAIDLSIRERHPLQDCFYLSLALQETAKLVTYDKRLFKTAMQVSAESRLLTA